MKPGVSAEEIKRAFRSTIKAIPCPGCGLTYTDAAVDWGDAWREGRRDLMDEQGWDERDGPYKLKCELCGHRAWLNIFARSVRSAEPPGWRMP